MLRYDDSLEVIMYVSMNHYEAVSHFSIHNVKKSGNRNHFSLHWIYQHKQDGRYLKCLEEDFGFCSGRRWRVTVQCWNITLPKLWQKNRQNFPTSTNQVTWRSGPHYLFGRGVPLWAFTTYDYPKHPSLRRFTKMFRCIPEIWFAFIST